MTAGRFVVLATDKVSEAGLGPLLQDERFEVHRIDDSTTPSFSETLRRAHGLIVRSATKVHGDLLDGAPELLVVGRAGVGVDNIDLEACTERGIAVCNAPAGNTVAAAELTLALMLAAVRRVAAADASVRAGAWARSHFQGAELRGRSLGLVGCGRIGGEVARRCRAFGMRVIAFDPYLTHERAEELRVERGSLDEVIAEADVLSLHVPLTDDTRGMIDGDTIRRMKRGAFVVNVARGGVVDESALADALEEGHLAGAALDVFTDEPLGADSPLRGAPNLVLTPHLGASTVEAQQMVATEIAEAVRVALAEGDLSRALNAPSISGDLLRSLAPLFDLARRMGRMACALSRGGVEELEVRYAGSSEEVLRPLSTFVNMGLLENVLGRDQVNFVSADHLAKQRGIHVARTVLDGPRSYPEYIELVVGAERGTLVLGGALLGDRYSRIVRIEDYRVDIVPEGVLIVLKNTDVPGVIGRVGTLLGDHGINIAGYHQARREKGGEALAAISVDGEVPPDVRNALLELDEVSSAVLVRLES